MQNDFDKMLENLLSLNASFKLGIKKSDSFLKKTIKYVIGNESSISFKKAKCFNRRNGLIVKDPFLVFASKYLSMNYKVIICERPLLPLAGSFKRMSWTFSEYNRLLKDLKRSGVNIQNPSQFDNDNISPFVVGAVQFFYLYRLFKKKIVNNDNIYFFNQNELAVNPSNAIMSLFDWINIDYSESDIDRIVSSISGSNENKSPEMGVQHDLLYDKNYANEYFKSILSEDEIKFVKECEDLICSGGEI